MFFSYCFKFIGFSLRFYPLSLAGNFFIVNLCNHITNYYSNNSFVAGERACYFFKT